MSLYLVKHDYTPDGHTPDGQIRGTTHPDFRGHRGQWYFSTAEGQPIRRYRGKGGGRKAMVFFNTKSSAVRVAKRNGLKVSSINVGNAKHPTYLVEDVTPQ